MGILGRPEVVTALITATSLIIVQLIMSAKQERVADLKHQNRIDLYEQKTNDALSEIKEDIIRLEQKQDKHNQLIERMVAVERDLANLKR